jgi:hypothetical protein
VRLRGSSAYSRISNGCVASYLVAFTLAGSVAKAQDKFGIIRGTVVIVESDGSTSVIPGAAVAINGRELIRNTTADDNGSYTIVELPPPDMRFELALLA